MSTVALERITLETADGETREATSYPDGSYACPFDGAAVISPAGWADNEANNARVYAASGDEYVPQSYPRTMRLVWEIRGCPNPACITLLNPVQLAARRQSIAELEADAAARKARDESFKRSLAESKSRQRDACDAARAKCEAEGYCFRCWSHSTSAGLSDSRERFTRHRDPETCPRLRTRYGI